MRYLSICSGIEAASVAWHALDWHAVGFSEIDPFPCAVLSHRFPDTPNFGDMTRHADWNIEPGSVDLVVGGTPCQSFSVAGLRRGLDDPRGNLMLTYLAIVRGHRPRWVIWENVPGVLSSNDGRDFGTFVGALADLGYGVAYRVLDAQWFGVAQRRRRVFVVGYLGDAARAAAVLFERESVRRDTPPRRAKGQGTAANVGAGADTVGTLCSDSHPGGYSGQDAYTGRLIPAALVAKGPHAVATAAVAPTITATNDPSRSPQSSEITQQVASVYAATLAVRRLTPRECERLQGFPDDWTAIPYRGKPAADGPRYKAIGNSMAVPVMHWLGKRVAALEGAP